MSEYLILQALNGLVIGLIYALMALGLTLIFSVLKIVNFAHGEFYMLGAYGAYYLSSALGLPRFLPFSCLPRPSFCWA